MKKVVRVLMGLIALGTMGLHAKRDDYVRSRLYAQDEQDMQLLEREKKARKDKLMRHAQRRIDRKKRTDAIAAYHGRVSEKMPEVIEGQYAHVYPLPAWPVPMQYSYNRHEVSLEATYIRSSRSFDEDGKRVDVSALELGSNPLVKDFFAPSYAVSENIVAPDKVADGNEYVIDLAETPMNFSAEHETRMYTASYAFNMRNNTVSVGIEIPVVEELRTLLVDPLVDDETYKKLRDSTPVTSLGTGAPTSMQQIFAVIRNNQGFREYYGTNTGAFFEDMLRMKGMKYRSSSYEIGLSDITFFATGSIHSQYLDRLQVGAQVMLPVDARAETKDFYPARTSDGKFVRAKIQASLLGKKGRSLFFKNDRYRLHARCAIEAALPATVKKRVPKYVSKWSEVALGDRMAGTDIGSQIVDSGIPAFAQNVAELSVRPGVSFEAEIGALLLPVLWENCYADVVFASKLKMADSVTGLPEMYGWDLSWWNNASHSVTHKASLFFGYEKSDNLHLRIGLFTTLAGKRAAVEHGCSLTLTGRW